MKRSFLCLTVVIAWTGIGFVLNEIIRRGNLPEELVSSSSS